MECKINLPDQLKNLASINGFSEKQLELSLESIRQLSSICTYCISIEVGLSSGSYSSDFFSTVIDVVFDYPPCDNSPEMYFLSELKDIFISDVLHDYPDFKSVYQFKILDIHRVYSYPMGVQTFRCNSVEVKKDVE